MRSGRLKKQLNIHVKTSVLDNMNIQILLKEIKLVFPLVEMPIESEILHANNDCFQNEGLIQDIEEYRGQEISGEVIRLLHQEMSYLSAKAWRWVLPHYLMFCLTPEAEYNLMETEFLIYALSPSLEFQSDVKDRISLLNPAQINCLIHFFEWCQDHDHWKIYCPDDLDRGKVFLSNVKGNRN